MRGEDGRESGRWRVVSGGSTWGRESKRLVRVSMGSLYLGIVLLGC